MKPVELDLSTLIFVVGTRVALAFGVGLLVADHIPAGRRRALALSLIGLGAATTIPAALAVFGPRPAVTMPTEALDDVLEASPR
jgi:hypothetical protein